MAAGPFIEQVTQADLDWNQVTSLGVAGKQISERTLRHA
jgi:hypothetical protein